MVPLRNDWLADWFYDVWEGEVRVYGPDGLDLLPILGR